MANERNQQFLFARETQPGVAIGAGQLLAAANGKLKITSISKNINPDQYKRATFSTSRSGLTTISGIVNCDFEVQFEIAGSTATAPSTPVFSLLLESCGIEAVRHNRLYLPVPLTTPGSFPVFEHNEIVQNAGATALARVMHDTWNNQTTLRYLNTLTALSQGNTITGQTNGASSLFATGAAADEGLSWCPTSAQEVLFTYASATGSGLAGHVYKGNTSGAIVVAKANPTAGGATERFYLIEGTLTATETLTSLSITTSPPTIVNISAISTPLAPTLTCAILQHGRYFIFKGCRGSFKFTAQNGQPCIVTYSAKGTLHAIADFGQIDGITYESRVPPKFMGVEFKVGSHATGQAGYQSYTTENTPRITSFSFDWGQQIELQEDATQATGIVIAQFVGNREGKFTFNPEVRPDGVFPFMAMLRDGALFRARCKLGTAAQNTFLMTWPSLKIESAPGEARKGFLADQINATCSGVSAKGADRDEAEFVMSYIDSITSPGTAINF